MDRSHRGGGRGGGGGGSYRSSAHHAGGQGGRGRQQEFQRSYVGNKRDREVERDPFLELVEKLMRLCDRNPALTDNAEALEHEMQSAVALCKTALNHRLDTQLQRLLLDCVVQLATKTPVYAALIGLLNDEAPEFIGDLVLALANAFATALQSGDRSRARLLLRLFCALALSNVLHASGVVALLESLVAVATTTASTAADATGHTWQAYTDYLVYIVAAALPWGGSELPESVPAELQRLLDSMGAYVTKRPIAADEDLQPFSGALNDEDAAAKCAGGVVMVCTRVIKLLETRLAADLVPGTINEMQFLLPMGATHATGATVALAAARPHELPAIQIPEAPPGLSPELPRVQASAFLRVAFPPRGGIVLLDRRHTEADRPAIERFVAEEYFLDTIAAWDGEKAECVRRLGAGLPIPWPYVNLLAEFLFGQLLALPLPQLPLPAYDLLLIELCKLPPDRFPFAKALSACTRELFARMKYLDPELRCRLAAWLSSHLSHFGFRWPWERWQHALDAPPSDPQRQFCADVIERLVRLAYWDKIHASLPEGFRVLLGPRPVMPLLPGQAQPTLAAQEAPAPPQAQAAGASGEHSDEPTSAAPAAAGAPAAPATAGDAAPDVPMTAAVTATPLAAAAAAEAPEGEDPELALAGRLLASLRGAAPAPGEAAPWISGRELLEWLTEHGPPEWAEEPVGALRVVMRALLAVGAKSPTHLHAAFQRYEEPMRALLAGCGEAGGLALLQLAAEFYASLPQKLLMVADRLLALHLIGGGTVVRWAFGSEALRHPSDVRLNRVAWDMVHFAVDQALQLPTQGEEEARAKAEEVEACRDKAKSFADKCALAADMRNQRGVMEATAAEEKMMEAAGALQAELDQQVAALDALQEEPAKVLLQAFSCFAEFLAQQEQASGVAAMQVDGASADDAAPAAAASAPDTEASGTAVTGEGTVAAVAGSAEQTDELAEHYARLRAFTRHYRVPALPFAERLAGEVFAAGAAPERARATVEGLFHW